MQTDLPQSTPVLHVQDLTYRLGDRALLDQASVAVPEGARIGLVGRNGAGKTTLFKLILGEIAAESGQITLPRGVRIATVSQEAPAGPEPLVDVVLAADIERARLMQRRETEADPLAIAEIETRLADIGAHSAPARAAAILYGLGFDAEAIRRPCADFSGGWRMRVALAATLFAEPDLLLLDEPTNYLDLEGAIWLNSYLARYPHTVVTISHDREFLDTVVDHILHLERGKLTVYRGGYSDFEARKAEKEVLDAKAAAKQEAERKHLQAFVDRFKAKASKARQAQSRVKRLEKMKPVAVLRSDEVQGFHLPGPERPASPPLIALESVAAGYGEKPVLARLNLTILPDDRIALLGSNGNGKSTFCKLISGRLKPMGGEIKVNPKSVVSYFAQHQVDELVPAQSAFQHVRSALSELPEARQRAVAARFGFSGARSDTPVSQLSGGEKARLTLGLIGLQKPHLLILDEPTNHLDVESRSALIEAINDFPGAVMLVSHDRHLVESCAERLWLVRDGSVRNFDGDLDDYRTLILKGDQPAASRPAEPVKAEIAPPRRSGSALKREFEAAEARLEKLQTLLAKLDSALGGDAFQTDPAKALQLSRQRAELEEAIASAEEAWLTASMALEDAT